MAVNGLNLRESPSLKGIVIASIPFLDKVKLVQEADTYEDTVGTVSFGGYNDFTQQIIGEWVKVQYQKKEGYVFNAYLMSEYFEESSQGEDSQYALSFPGTNCYENVHRNKDIRWKGVFKNGNSYEVKEVNLEYYMSFDEMGQWYGVTTDSNDSLLFMLGAVEDKFPNGQIAGRYRDYGMEFDYSKRSSTVENMTLHLLEDEAYLSISEGNQQQKIESHGVVFILWKGDLDGDGKTDYIFTIGEKSSSTVLFLSSEAEEGQIVNPVASYFSGYCC